MLDINVGELRVVIDPATETIDLGGLRCSADAVVHAVEMLTSGETLLLRVSPIRIGPGFLPVFERTTLGQELARELSVPTRRDHAADQT